MPPVFINYRVREQAGYAALLDRALTERFGPDTVFRDFRSVRPGDDFVREILGTLRSATALLAVIGPGWTVRGADQDWVHRELAEAFAAGVRVIPVLVEDAGLPREAELPPDIAALGRCQALTIRYSNVEEDLERVVTAIGRLLPARTPEHVTVHRLPGSGCRVGVVNGTIRRVRFADVWVNPENTDMEMARISEFSVSAIIRYGGARLDAAGRVREDLIADELRAAAPDLPVAPGTAVVTGAGRLAETHNVRYVIHVACVQGEPASGYRQVRRIGDCVANVLGQADQLNAATILIPLLGTGLGGGAVEPTARAVVGAAADYLTARPHTALEAVYFLGYTAAEAAAITAAIAGVSTN